MRGLGHGDPLSPMLFIPVMDALNSLIQKARDDGCCSPYLVDYFVIVFLLTSDLELIKDILHVLGGASGLKTNIQKSSAIPIQCFVDDSSVVQEHLPSEVKELPCKYIGLLSSIKKLTTTQIQPTIDRIADQPSGWKVEVMTRAG